MSEIKKNYDAIEELHNIYEEEIGINFDNSIKKINLDVYFEDALNPKYATLDEIFRYNKTDLSYGDLAETLYSTFKSLGEKGLKQSMISAKTKFGEFLADATLSKLWESAITNIAKLNPLIQYLLSKKSQPMNEEVYMEEVEGQTIYIAQCDNSAFSTKELAEKYNNAFNQQQINEGGYEDEYYVIESMIDDPQKIKFINDITIEFMNTDKFINEDIGIDNEIFDSIKEAIEKYIQKMNLDKIPFKTRALLLQSGYRDDKMPDCINSLKGLNKQLIVNGNTYNIIFSKIGEAGEITKEN